MCNIATMDSHGSTTGLAADFTQPSTSTGANALSPPMTSNNGLTFTFMVLAASLPTLQFQVFESLASGGSIVGSGSYLAVYGIPTTASTLVCFGHVSGTTTIRVNEQIDCTISVQDAKGPTTGFSADFNAPTFTAGGSGLTTLSTSNHGSSLLSRWQALRHRQLRSKYSARCLLAAR